MSRSGYRDDYDGNEWDLIRWRGAVASAIRGKRGQAFLIELRAALDAMPEKRLIPHSLEREHDGAVCALGSVGRARGMVMDDLNPEDYTTIASKFGINEKLVQEIEFTNDEAWTQSGKTSPEERWRQVRAWVEKQIHIVPDAELRTASATAVVSSSVEG